MKAINSCEVVDQIRIFPCWFVIANPLDKISKSSIVGTCIQYIFDDILSAFIPFDRRRGRNDLTREWIVTDRFEEGDMLNRMDAYCTRKS